MATFLKFVLSFLLLCCMNRALDGLESKRENHQFHTLQVTSLLPSSVCTSSSKGQKGRASLKVVHRHGPCSHLNQDKSNAPPLTQILAHDQSRVDSLQSRISFATGKMAFQDLKVTLPAKSGVSLGSGNYIVTVGLGTPKKDLSLIFDTGSDLTWTQCQPCVRSCYAQQEPIFDPSLSTSYSNITCSSALCSSLRTATGNPPGCMRSTCVYRIVYGDRSFSVGYFGKDKLTLSSTDVLNGFLFGCGQYNQGLFGETAGLLGLGRDDLSIISQSTKKYGKYFSYCLPSSSSSTGYLTFGKGKVSKSVKYTPFANSQNTSFYFIEILDIYVGGTKLGINPVVFSNAGTIIDSGTVITRLPPAAYSSLSKTFQEKMAKYPRAPALSILDTCYDLSNYTIVLIPKISFLFGGRVKVDLGPSNILLGQRQSQICLAFAGNSNPSDVGIFGNYQQKGLQVEYDLPGGKLGFGSKGCA
ncbi:hypothetical protein LguiA_036623 [Lonicera macranthoides]